MLRLRTKIVFSNFELMKKNFLNKISHVSFLNQKRTFKILQIKIYFVEPFQEKLVFCHFKNEQM
jgi:hypothetical protein